MRSRMMGLGLLTQIDLGVFFPQPVKIDSDSLREITADSDVHGPELVPSVDFREQFLVLLPVGKVGSRNQPPLVVGEPRARGNPNRDRRA